MIFGDFCIILTSLSPFFADDTNISILHHYWPKDKTKRGQKWKIYENMKFNIRGCVGTGVWQAKRFYRISGSFLFSFFLVRGLIIFLKTLVIIKIKITCAKRGHHNLILMVRSFCLK